MATVVIMVTVIIINFFSALFPEFVELRKKHTEQHTCSLPDPHVFLNQCDLTRLRICKQDLGHAQNLRSGKALSLSLCKPLLGSRASKKCRCPGPTSQVTDIIGLGCGPENWSFHCSPDDSKVPPGLGTAGSGGRTERTRLE